MQTGKWFTGSGALLVILFFFLPWITVSCGNMQIGTLSGYQLAAGAEINTGFGAERTEGSGAVFLILLAGLVAVGLLTAMLTNNLPVRTGAIGQLISGLIGIIILWLTWMQINQNVAEVGGSVKAEAGLWLTALGFIAIFAGAVITLVNIDDRHNDNQRNGDSFY